MVKIKIDGMSCNHCVKSVTKALSEVIGVKNVSVSLENKEAIVDGVGLNIEDLANAITNADFKVVEISKES